MKKRSGRRIKPESRLEVCFERKGTLDAGNSVVKRETQRRTRSERSHARISAPSCPLVLSRQEYGQHSMPVKK